MFRNRMRTYDSPNCTFLSEVSTRRCLGKPNWPISDTKLLVECSLPFICISEWCCVSKLHYVVKSSWHHNMIIRINKSGFFQIFSTFFWNQITQVFMLVLLYIHFESSLKEYCCWYQTQKALEKYWEI